MGSTAGPSDLGKCGWRRRLRAVTGRGSCVNNIDQILQFLAGLKERNLLRRHVDLGSGLGVTADARLAFPRAETAEAADLNLVAGAQRMNDAVEDRVDDLFRIL